MDFRHEENQERPNGGGRRFGLLGMHKLSGGEKTVVAICILMSLQVCNPAPFYVFDEMDAALDPRYRSNIRNVFQANGKHAQYFITTFREELLHLPDAHIYQVEFESRTSKMAKCDSETALALLQIS